ncbi:woronin body major protein [Penicillium digitatum]|uniref:Woronin body major protein n=1 Tax=Penicillium digitatum TaxID=36651 RepID=A0A7T7BKN9_PENDI|nr:woronin body major protein [Penicillium digitatum]
MVFGRRKRSASAHHQPLSAPAAQSAQSAASHAFLKSQPSTASLSSAAAAAALRNSTPTPTLVENVQTKRMVQRRSSTHSHVNPVGGRRSASLSTTLRRSSSNSSMSARTFRDQSPHRPATSSGPVGSGPPPIDVPPLPSLPTQFSPRKLPNRRTVSVEPSIRSPPLSPPRAGMRGVDRERGRGSPIQLATHQRVTGLGTVPELERSASRNSVNFSYPMGSRSTSSIAMPENTPMSLRDAIQESIAEISDKIPKGKPRTQPSGSLEESFVANQSGHLAGSAGAAAQAVCVPNERPSANVQTGNVRNSPQEADALDQHTGKTMPVVTSAESEHPSSRAVPERWPSTVREEPEDDDLNVEGIPIRKGRERTTSASPTADNVEAAPMPSSSSPSSGLQIGQQPRRQSSSPGRTARFSRLLSVAGTDDQVHQPPLRSVSPVKSALKHPRGGSLSPDGRVGVTGRALTSNELSDGTSVASDEGSRVDTRKKSAKVSFDDEAEVVNLAASPPTSPEEYTSDFPPAGKAKPRTNWLGVGKKKSPADFASDDDWDVVIKPRKVLPSFGSIRGSRGGALKRSPIPDFSDNESCPSSASDVAPRPDISLSKEYFQPSGLGALEKLSVNGSLHTLCSDANKREAGLTDNITEKQPCSSVGSTLSVPTIAVEPATPPADGTNQSFDLKRYGMDQYRIPGGFAPSSTDRTLDSGAKKTTAQAVASAVPRLDDVDTEEESGDSIYSDAAENMDGDGDATPRPIGRAAILDSQSQDVTVQPLEEHSVTPTHGSVNRLVEEFPASSVGHGLGSTYPPVPTQLQTRTVTGQNGSVQAQRTMQPRPMSADVDGASRTQDLRWSSNDASLQGSRAKLRTLSVGPTFHSLGGQTGIPDTLRRNVSNGSDSSSSFKRSSPRPDTHSMRRTMRAGTAGANVRVLSPTERNEFPIEHRPLSSGSSNGAMRKTLRGPTGGERYSFFSTNKKALPRAKFTKAPPRSARATRLANSDGEDEARPQVFTSRFADSSDEDEPGSNKLRPVRGIPRRQGADDGDSTELEDSSEESAQQQALPVLASHKMTSPSGSRGKSARNMSGMAAVAKQRGMSQRDLEEFIMAPPGGRKRGLLTRLGIKKPKNPDHRVFQTEIESPLERSYLELDQPRSEGMVNENYVITPTTVSAGNPESPRSAKLVKRNSKRQSTGPDTWPLHSNPKEEASLQPVAEQPYSASSSTLQKQNPALPTHGAGAAQSGSTVLDGNGAHSASPIANGPGAPHERPDPNSDSTSEVTTPDNHGLSVRDVVIAGSGRKKRFPLFRKAFGLCA